MKIKSIYFILLINIYNYSSNFIQSLVVIKKNIETIVSQEFIQFLSQGSEEVFKKISLVNISRGILKTKTKDNKKKWKQILYTEKKTEKEEREYVEIARGENRNIFLELINTVNEYMENHCYDMEIFNLKIQEILKKILDNLDTILNNLFKDSLNTDEELVKKQLKNLIEDNLYNLLSKNFYQYDL